MPDFSLEDQYDGNVIGIDEVGRGPLAGPVVAASVYIPDDIRLHSFVSDIKDSKKLSKPKLKILNSLIHEYCIVSITEVPPKKIDELNILQASLLAMRQSCEFIDNLDIKCALIDGNKTPKEMPCAAQHVVKGDSISKSIAAASIVAKHHRDSIMEELALAHPHYGWERNVGYPTPEHRDAIKQFGITKHHRKSFAPVRIYMESRLKNVS